MDYVVFGIGFGATVLVLGLLLRDLGPRLRYRRQANGDGVLPADVLVAKVAWDRFCNALGAVLAIGGLLVLLTTFVCIALMLSDDTGGWVMLAALAVFFLLVLYWTWAFFDRFGGYGILPERAVVEDEPEPAPAAASPSDGEAGPQAPDRVIVGPTLDEARPAEDAEADDDVPEAADAVEDERELAPGDDADEEEHPVVTPEERLAEAEEPIDHGSAAGDLDTAPGVARPAMHRNRAAGASAGAPDEASASVGDARQDVESDVPAEPETSDPEDAIDEVDEPESGTR